jgi:hypothetical protein
VHWGHPARRKRDEGDPVAAITLGLQEFEAAIDRFAGGGARYHAIAEEGVAIRDIAEAIGRRLNPPVVAKSPEAAAGLHWLAHFAAVDALGL